MTTESFKGEKSLDKALKANADKEARYHGLTTAQRQDRILDDKIAEAEGRPPEPSDYDIHKRRLATVKDTFGLTDAEIDSMASEATTTSSGPAAESE